MESDFYLDILNYLSAFGINVKVDITNLVLKYYPEDGDYDLSPRISQVKFFLDKMEESANIRYDIVEIFDHNQSMQPIGYTIVASLTITGFNFLANVKRDESTLQTNTTISKQSKLQTRVLIGALFISAISLIISIVNAVESSKIPQLLPSKELIQLLKSKQDQSQRKVDSVPKKTSIKKN
ncbi:MAG TPA: hypothetical protein VIM89_10115 [Mucilaginibacter sp.]